MAMPIEQEHAAPPHHKGGAVSLQEPLAVRSRIQTTSGQYECAPTQLCVTLDNHILLVYRQTIDVLDRAGTLLSTLVTGFAWNRCVCITPRNYIAVLGWMRDDDAITSVRVFNLEGSLRLHVTGQAIANCLRMDVDDADHIYLFDAHKNLVSVISPGGQLLSTTKNLVAPWGPVQMVGGDVLMAIVSANNTFKVGRSSNHASADGTVFTYQSDADKPITILSCTALDRCNTLFALVSSDSDYRPCAPYYLLAVDTEAAKLVQLLEMGAAHGPMAVDHQGHLLMHDNETGQLLELY